MSVPLFVGLASWLGLAAKKPSVTPKVVSSHCLDRDLFGDEITFSTEGSAAIRSDSRMIPIVSVFVFTDNSRVIGEQDLVVLVESDGQSIESFTELNVFPHPYWQPQGKTIFVCHVRDFGCAHRSDCLIVA